MNITFDVPQLYSPGSSPEEKRLIVETLEECLDAFRRDGGKGIFARKPSLARTAPTQVTFSLPDAFRPKSTPLANAQALRTLLRCLSSVNSIYLDFRPGLVTPLYLTPVYYRRTIVWDSTPALYARLYGDCKSLACCQDAEYRHQGVPCDTTFRFDPPRDDRPLTLFHILLRTPYGVTVFEDPSKAKGMGADENAQQHQL